MSAVVNPRLGLIVTVTFKGDVERHLGQADLAHALLALTVTPAGAHSPPIGVLDSGGGFRPSRVPIPQDGRITLKTIDLFSPERILQTRTLGRATAVRHGSQVIFHLAAPATAQLKQLELKVFANAPVWPPSRTVWHSIQTARPTHSKSAAINPACAQLQKYRRALATTISSGLKPELRRQQQAHTQLRIAGPIRTPNTTLTTAIRRTANRIASLKRQIRTLQAITHQLDREIKACAPPPPTPTPPTPTPTPTPPTPPPPPPPAVQVVQTNPAQSQYMAPQPGLALSSTPPQNVPIINVNDQARYQQFSGIGAAMTDSSAWLIYNKLSLSSRVALMQDLFGAPGSQPTLPAPAIHLNFLRVAMGASGAMTATPPYTYDDNNNQPDPTLANFSIAHDDAYMIPTLQQALAINPSLQILANPWSPPAWMKSNDSLGNQNASGSLLSADYQPYANYFVKFIQAYQQDGIPIDAITPANEPTSNHGGTPYPGLNLPESAEADFIANYLQPALSAAGLHPKIYGNDLSWDQFSPYASPLTADPAAGPDLNGMAWHCYFGSPTVMSQVQQQAPALDQIVDECSPEIRSFGTPEFLISTLRNWAGVAAIWSIALDPNGQPIQPGNHCGGCRGAVSIDQQTGAVTFRPEYYQLGQVSAFVQPGATRIDSTSFVTYGTNASNIETVSPGLDDVAFSNPDGSKVLVAYNNSTAPISFGVASNGSYYTYTIPPQAMTTFVWP